jgi:hypothetical protein
MFNFINSPRYIKLISQKKEHVGKSTKKFAKKNSEIKSRSFKMCSLLIDHTLGSNTHVALCVFAIIFLLTAHCSVIANSYCVMVGMGEANLN